MKNTTKKPIYICRTDRQTQENQVITLAEAELVLSGNWNKDAIIPMLMEGQVLWTPYAEYSLYIPN